MLSSASRPLQLVDDLLRPWPGAWFQSHHFLPGGTRRFSSSNQFSTTLICVPATSAISGRDYNPGNLLKILSAAFENVEDG
jgi:hypothetical protein